MKEFNSENLIKNLSDAFKKSTDSNNYKILEIDKVGTRDIMTKLQEIAEINDIDKAKGKELDLIGEEFQLKRGKASDEAYRLLIKGKIAQNVSEGTRENVAAVLSFVLRCNKSDVHIVSGSETGTATLKELPYGILLDAGFSVEQINSLIDDLLPVGVKLNSYLYTGTFTYGSINDSSLQDSTKGYGSLEDSTIGGYYGILGGK